MVNEGLKEAQKTGLTKEQKTGFVLLLIFAVLAIVLGVLQIRNTMYKPFALNNSIPPSVKDDINNTDNLRYRDTDFDGLSDFDELYVYNTSAYLADSDSDGVSDYDEIARGDNPLCAKGKECITVSTNESGAERPSGTSTVGLAEPQKPIDLNSALTDPKELRKFFIENGFPQSELDKLSDEELMAGVKNTIETSGILTGSVASSSENTQQ